MRKLILCLTGAGVLLGAVLMSHSPGQPEEPSLTQAPATTAEPPRVAVRAEETAAPEPARQSPTRASCPTPVDPSLFPPPPQPPPQIVHTANLLPTTEAVPWDDIEGILGRPVTHEQRETVLEAKHRLGVAHAKARIQMRSGEISAEEHDQLRRANYEGFKVELQRILGCSADDCDAILALRGRRPQYAEASTGSLHRR